MLKNPNITVLDWLDSNHFVGTIERFGKRACYGWSKGGSFFIYTIQDGHIQKLGTVKASEIVDDDHTLVVQ